MNRQPSSTADPSLDRLIAFFGAREDGHGEKIPHPAGHEDEIMRLADGVFRKAAVLIPVVKPSIDKPSRIILTVRSSNLSSHAGQVSLPGGTREHHDTGDIMTALREAEEEVGLVPEAVQIIGQLGRILLPSGFEVTPIVGLVEPEPVLRPCPIEVAEIFMPPTSLLLDPGAYTEATMEYRGARRSILEVFYGGFRIWGATATILHHLASRLDQDRP